MTCSFCGTELPPGALFCGECGRPVAGATPISVDLATAPPPLIEQRQTVEHLRYPVWPSAEHPVPPLVLPRSDGAATVVCEQCGSPMSEEDIFCGECGFVSRAASEDFGRSRDTAIIELSAQRMAEPRREPPPVIDRLPDFEVPSEQGTSPVVQAPVGPPIQPELVLPFEPAALGRERPFDDSVDLEATRISPGRRAGERFVLQFSTGESFTVYGSGLIGRNPRSEPGEYFDQLVRVLDPSRSVSKVHLEFGQDSGRFWVMDRFSGNGTIVREPESAAVRCQPEKRYRIARGTRVDIGEQFFIVS
ncbi:MAG: zinc ribbon domain-containing protein [Actinomycetota bacterium]